jgi:plasmid stabilization system protein ParE
MKLELTKLAAAKLELLLAYLESEWSAKVREEFLKKVTRKFTHLTVFPKSCPESQVKRGLRKIVLSKQTSAFYKIEKDKIVIITIFDNRQDPASVLDELIGF